LLIVPPALALTPLFFSAIATEIPAAPAPAAAPIESAFALVVSCASTDTAPLAFTLPPMLVTTSFST
jgi:hypothetical protein